MMVLWSELPLLARVLAIVVAALAAHGIVRALQSAVMRRLAGGSPYAGDARDGAFRSSPKLATLTGLTASVATFFVFFIGLGLVLQQFDLDLREYLVTASVIGLAVGFGSQGLVQDIVIGLTLIFTDVMDVGDMVEVSGQIGRVEKIGLRFTTVTNFLGQTVFVPNRNIATVGRFRGGVVRAYLHAQQPAGIADADFAAELARLTEGFRSQFPGIVFGAPEVGPVTDAGAGLWRYARVKLRLWPGQGALVESALRPRVTARLKELDPTYADWMVVVTYRTEAVRRTGA